ncbi:SubName: Full=Related to Agaricus bisporus lectin-Agaricus bisporus {ECO:0000313/EMBL:CCA74595.1} [Serendipita indica DSM 11827]|nr:SubName: Full=Related to Agaricus bisporus lectin-Agaricus bisporus {ECO:0000313/EMBL:CCA74595.1} [Serendipita indica DSM 11827]
MSYKIRVRIYQTKPDAFFRVVEQSVWTGGSWTKNGDEFILDMHTSGTSGALRLLADNGEHIIAVFGVHNYKRWCDIVTALGKDASGTKLLPEWYVEGTNRGKVKWSQLAEYNVDSTTPVRRNFAIKYTIPEGNDLVATLFVGW